MNRTEGALSAMTGAIKVILWYVYITKGMDRDVDLSYCSL